MRENLAGAEAVIVVGHLVIYRVILSILAKVERLRAGSPDRRVDRVLFAGPHRAIEIDGF